MKNEELVLLYQQGDETALEKILEDNKKMVYALANKFYIGKSNSIDVEDLVQEGYIGLMLATQKYDFHNPKKAKFITYAVHWVYAKINRFIEQKNTNEEISLNTPIQDGETELGDTIEDDTCYYDQVEKSLYHQEVRIEIEKIMKNKLTLKENNIIKLFYGWDRARANIDEIAEIQESNKKCIINTRSNALDKIRRTPWARQEYIKRQLECV